MGPTDTAPTADIANVPINPNLPWQSSYSALFGALKLGKHESVKHIAGVEGMTVGQMQDELQKGGRFVVYPYAMSFLIMTLRQASPITFVRAGENRVTKGLKYFFISLVLGWWGIPWGLIYTPTCLITDIRGGKDVTAGIAEPLIQNSVATARG